MHGFTQTGRSWDPLVAPFASAGFTVHAPDLAGHGRCSDLDLDVDGDGRRLAAALGPAVWVGYSLGGRTCLHAALAVPGAVRGLVLVSASPGIEDGAERSARRRSDDELAASIESAGDAGLPAFVDRWLSGPLWAGLSRDAAGVPARLENRAAGLASSLRHAGTGTQAWLLDRLGTITVPTLIVSGAADTKFTDLGRRMATAIGDNAAAFVVPGAGHAVPWEQPVPFTEGVVAWLHRHGFLTR